MKYNIMMKKGNFPACLLVPCGQTVEGPSVEDRGNGRRQHDEPHDQNRIRETAPPTGNVRAVGFVWHWTRSSACAPDLEVAQAPVGFVYQIGIL